MTLPRFVVALCLLVEVVGDGPQHLRAEEKEARRLADSIELPKAEFGESFEGYETMTIDVDARNAIWIDMTELTLEQVKIKLNDFAALNEKSAMIVRATGETRVTVIDAITRAARDCGIKKIKYETRVEE